ncbi:hypothetical protein LUZ60_008012 [Juncus effusus]|nr:hypothetical protein LUZ60_008012 [Juncus effusus]
MDSSKRTLLKSILSPANGGLQFAGERVTVGGWVKSFHVNPRKDVKVDSPAAAAADVTPPDLTCAEVLFLRVPLFRCLLKVLSNHPVREKLERPVQKKMDGTAYIRINDGSSVHNLQVVIDSNTHQLEQITAIGTSVLLQGVIEQSQKEGKYSIELKVDTVLHVGPVNPDKYPLSKLRLSLETIQASPHFRTRTTTIASVVRIRSKLIHAMHNFFQENNFHHVTMPIITTTPIKSSNSLFHVTHLFNDPNYIKNEKEGRITLEGIKASIKEKTKQIEELKRSDSNNEALITAETDLKKTNELALELEKVEKEKSKSLDKIVKVDFSKDYFGCEAYLSSNAGAHLESYACALGSVYHFGPVFNPVENQFKKNLAEMWVLNAEIAFTELEDAMKRAEDCLKYISNSILTSCFDDINFLSSRFDNKCMDRVHALLSSNFPRVSYTEAVEALQKVTDKKFETKIEWGADLSDELQSYLVDEIHKQPIIVYDYPKETQPFYARMKDDEKTVSAFEIIFPKAGTVASGTQKEERTYMISSRIKEAGLSEEKMDWYVDLRRHGTVKHTGFDINFERLVMFLSGLGDVRDVIPFPRTKNDVKC